MSERANPSPKQANVQLLGASIRSRMAQWTGPGRLKPPLLHPNHHRTLQRIQHRNSSCNLYSHLFEPARRLTLLFFQYHQSTHVHHTTLFLFHFYRLLSFVRKNYSYDFTKLLLCVSVLPNLNHFTDFQETLYEYYTIDCISKYVNFSFLQSVIKTWQTCKLVVRIAPLILR